MTTVTDVRVRNHSTMIDPVGTTTRIFMSIERVLPVPFVPCEESLSFAFNITAEAKSTVSISAEFAWPDGTRIFVPFPSEEADSTSREVELPSTTFTLKTAGIYTFRLFVDNQLKWSSELEVIIGP